MDYHQHPKVYEWCMKQCLIIAKKKKVLRSLLDMTYLGVDFVDPLYGGLDVPAVDEVPDVNPFLNGLNKGVGLDIRLDSEVLSSFGVAFADQVVHDQGINMSIHNGKGQQAARHDAKDMG